ncbi:uncharacterized protein LOC106180548 [Lingula anatina]|uniref:Uncharacterized protein LOC106180548 n=1 Tax=Lingula anatina TaxID=7574 RepID=A0A1S3KBK1_LINAN|nr:uncharacterized protein LOC106180548 [Lingula anatina]|eukprot:XP_013420010.1 uncharacterized protein LOC106180548 [Lingula anatina]
MKLKYFHDKTTTNFMHLMQKKENFSLMSQEEKIRSVAKNLEQLIDEVPLFLVRVEELMSALDEKVTWKEWKYLFKLGTSKVAWGLGKVVGHKPSLKAMISQICDMVHREQFNSSLVALGLSDPPATTTTTTTTTSTANGATSAMPKKVNPKTSPAKYAQLSSVESLCQSPLARDSSLAGGAVKLLREGRGTDMIFEIIVVQESGDVVVDHTHGEPVSRTDHSKEVDIHEIQAHCVIIAARCDWFRRALLSGMRESIDKKITVHDTNPSLFRLFLEYLYSGQLETNEMSTEQLADMMAIGDRYEVDSLKSLCENTLKHHLDEDSSLFLLSLAEQYNATALRSSALNFITEHPKVMESEVFEELPEHLQSEVADAVLWHGLDSRSRSLSGHSHTETPPSSVSGLSHTERLMAQLDIDSEDDKTNSSSSEEMNYVEDSGRLDACLESLRDIVGDGVPREELVRVALAADYDVNRALNFFFSA